MKKDFKIICLSLLVFTNILSAQKDKKTYDIVVAIDGSGNFTKLQEAFDAVPDNSLKRTIIFVKAGRYKEKLKLISSKKNVTLIGESYQNTILTYDDYAEIAGGTSKSFSTLIEADGFFAENITFENKIDSYLPQYKKGGQAVALMINGDRSIFHNCKISGFQDTFYLKANKRAYIKDCIIDGTTDFIFGSGIALFENCYIQSKGGSYITASNQDVGKNKYGFVFKNCVVMEYSKGVAPNVSLGRPWGAGANVVFINCYEGSHIIPDGWSVWSKDPEHKAYNNWKMSFYAEYDCYGPGYQPNNRISWSHQLNKNEASEYTKEKIFGANTTTANNLEGDWDPVIEKDKCNSILLSKKDKNADSVFEKGFK
ncbi:pectin esterase [Flavobacterium sp. ANB]|uniref:pectinesterase family protein n=1 Tax=unclassified Flavobacterium TaxID=196869 RepID=UPI0012B8B5AD|nr:MULTISPECIES: pectinesterase family protein [unclassified Flavobacterium]MBF4517834.1 pectin esterase [Flavobacterium sp. ANB]MTD70561.1 pectin esterase [Flavobacterium sp. LC2016-13]